MEKSFIEKELIGSWKLFNMLFWGSFFAYLPFAILFGLFSLFGLVPVNF